MSPEGKAHFRNLSQALSKVRESSGSKPEKPQIVICPGVYRESFFCSKAVEIVGEGAVEEIVITAGEPCRVTATGCTIKGISFQSSVHILGGKVFLEECRFLGSEGEPGLVIGGAETEVTLRGCSIYTGGVGVSVGEKAKVQLEDCCIECQQRGLTAAEADVKILRCRLTAEGGVAVRVQEGASVDIRESVLSNGEWGIGVADRGSQLWVDKCEVIGNRSGGIGVGQGTTARILQTKFQGNQRGVHALGEGTTVHIAQSHFVGQKETAIAVAQGAIGEVLSCLFEQNPVGILQLQSEVLIRHCRLDGSGEVGIQVQEGAISEIYDCELKRSAVGIRVVGEGTRATILNSRVTETLGIGVSFLSKAEGKLGESRLADGEWGVVLDGASPILEESEFYNCGVLIQGGAKGSLRRCRITSGRIGLAIVGTETAPFCLESSFTDNSLVGVQIEGGATPHLQQCQVAKNEVGIIILHENTEPTIAQCRIEGHRESGIRIEEGAKGRILQSTIAENPWGVRLSGEGTNPLLCRCLIEEHEKGGVRIEGGANGTLEQCVVSSGQWGVVILGSGTTPCLSGCYIESQSGIGLAISQQAKPRIERCFIYNNDVGVAISGSGTAPIFSECTIRNNRVLGLEFFNGATGLMSHCQITGNSYGIRSFGAGTQPILNRCFLEGNGEEGLRIEKDALAEVDGNIARAVGERSFFSLIGSIFYRNKTKETD